MRTIAGVESLPNTKKRPNEDRYRLLGHSPVLTERHGSYREIPFVAAASRGHVYAVMDGVGGAPEGMRAAAHTAERLEAFFRAETPATHTALGDLVREINAEVHAFGMIPDTQRPRGATAATIAWFAPPAAGREAGSLHLLHAGDTVAWRYHGGTLQTLTRIHGTEKVLLNYVGRGESFELDVTSHWFDVGDALLLATDGLTKGLHDHEVAALLDEHPDDPPRAAKELVRRARSKGSADDITALVVVLEAW